MEITSLTNSKVKQWAKYKEKKFREQDQCFLIEGEHLIEEAHRAGLVDILLVEQGREPIKKGYVTYEVTSDILHKLSESVSGTWIMAVCHYPIYTNEQIGNRIIVLDDVQDPGNVGTIIRTALSFGYDSVLLSEHSVDMYNQKVIRSTQGSLFHIPVIRGVVMDMLQEIKQRKIPIYATALHNASPLREVVKPVDIALVFGNEGAGVSPAVLAFCNERVYIEMDTFESLNVAVAAGICMYECKG